MPEWEAHAWYVWLRERAVHSMPMPWSKELPTMQDVASHGVESHGVNKWRFRAFLIDNRGGAAERQAEGPVAKCCGSRLSKRRLVLSDPAETKLGCELRLVQLERELRVLDLCSGLGLVPWLLSKLGAAATVLRWR